MSVFKKLYSFLSGFEKIFFSVLFLFLSFAIVVEVIMRKMTANGFPWLQELCCYSFIIATFLGSSIAISSDDHPRMTALYSVVSPKTRLFLILLSDIICTLFFAYMTPFAIKQTYNSFLTGTLTSTIGLPLFIFFSVVPLSFIGMIVRYCFRIWDTIKKLRGGAET